MTRKQLSTLNSIVTYYAENVPGGLNTSEDEVAKLVARWTLDGIPVVQVCPHCGEIVPVDEGRRHWMRWHIHNRMHRVWCDLHYAFGRITRRHA